MLADYTQNKVVSIILGKILKGMILCISDYGMGGGQGGGCYCLIFSCGKLNTFVLKLTVPYQGCRDCVFPCRVNWR